MQSIQTIARQTKGALQKTHYSLLCRSSQLALDVKDQSTTEVRPPG